MTQPLTFFFSLAILTRNSPLLLEVLDYRQNHQADLSYTVKCVLIVFSSETFNVAILVVAGKKFEAIEGQNVTISFDIDEVEKADHVKISFKEDKKKYFVLIAQKPWLYDDPPPPDITPIYGKGRVSVIIQDVSISRSGLFKAEAYTGAKVSEETATLVVHKAPVSSTTSPPHSSPSPKPPRSADLHWLYALIPVFIIIFILSVCFWKYGMIPCFKREKDSETSSSDHVSVDMNGCGENTEALLTDTH